MDLGHQRATNERQCAYWPKIDDDIETMVRKCGPCAEQQNRPPKAANHPWMLPEKPRSRVHIDHAMDFFGHNWLVMVGAYTKYLIKDQIEEDFGHFGNPHTIVSHNATSFKSEEFQQWCRQRGIVHLTGALYHPAKNGAAERLVHTFKQSLRKSKLSPARALQEFLQEYKRMPL